MGKELGINIEIINAKPTDGLWDDFRNDEDQIGLSYDQLEEAQNDLRSVRSNGRLHLSRSRVAASELRHNSIQFPPCVKRLLGVQSVMFNG